MRTLFRILAVLLNLIFGLVLLCFLPTVFHQFERAFADFMGHDIWWRFAAGMVPGFALGLLLIRTFPWFCVFDHEVTHALAGPPLDTYPLACR